MRTTLDLDKPVLQGLKKLQAAEKRSLSRIASQLLAEALDARQKRRKPVSESLLWNVSSMGARVDLQDKDAVYAILDAPCR